MTACKPASHTSCSRHRHQTTSPGRCILVSGYVVDRFIISSGGGVCRLDSRPSLFSSLPTQQQSCMLTWLLSTPSAASAALASLMKRSIGCTRWKPILTVSCVMRTSGMQQSSLSILGQYYQRLFLVFFWGLLCACLATFRGHGHLHARAYGSSQQPMRWWPQFRCMVRRHVHAVGLCCQLV